MANIDIRRTHIRIYADHKKVLLRPLLFGLDPKRIDPVVTYVSQKTEDEVSQEIEKLEAEFAFRHYNFKEVCLANYKKVNPQIENQLTENQKYLIGAYFTNEYSIQASALFNPSIVPLGTMDENGNQEFVLSLRATGEGHISSLAFQSGRITSGEEIVVDTSEKKITEGQISPIQKLPTNYVLSFIGKSTPANDSTLIDLNAAIAAYSDDDNAEEDIKNIFDACYTIQFPGHIPLSSRVLFPHSKMESNGIEDVRFVRFEEENFYLGTYTAYNGKQIRAHLIKTADFLNFEIYPLAGAAVKDKGLAFFPRKINDKYYMVGRQDGRSLFLMQSDNMLIWDQMDLFQSPGFTWDMLQIGNNGSPVETDEGWLLLTHAVGPMRKYTLSISLLERENPGKVRAVLEQPLMAPTEEEREGYVPNVLYTCGMMRFGNLLVIPYAMSDSAISFATVEIDHLLHQLRKA